jgi:hypothetical protein
MRSNLTDTALAISLILASCALVGQWWAAEREADRQARISAQAEAGLLQCLHRERSHR